MNTVSLPSFATEYPDAWADLASFYDQIKQSLKGLPDYSIDQLPFEIQLGIYLKFFDENGVDIDLDNSTYSELPERVKEAFVLYDHLRRHSS